MPGASKRRCTRPRLETTLDTLAETVRRLHELIEPVLEADGLELIDLRYKRKGGKRGGFQLKLIIDRQGRTSYAPERAADGTLIEAGVTVHDCARTSKAIGPLLDVEDIIDSAYDFEVSSPGVNRPLKRPRHFELAVGLKVRVKSRVPMGEPATDFFIEKLKSADDEGITLNVGGKDLVVPYRLIAKANLEFEF